MQCWGLRLDTFFFCKLMVDPLGLPVIWGRGVFLNHPKCDLWLLRDWVGFGTGGSYLRFLSWMFSPLSMMSVDRSDQRYRRYRGCQHERPQRNGGNVRLKDLTSDVFACVCETRGYPINMDRGDWPLDNIWTGKCKRLKEDWNHFEEVTDAWSLTCWRRAFNCSSRSCCAVPY